MDYVDVWIPTLCHAWLCLTEYSGKMQKSLKESHSSEKSSSPILYQSQIPKILQTFIPSFSLSLVALFQATEKMFWNIFMLIFHNWRIAINKTVKNVIENKQHHPANCRAKELDRQSTVPKGWKRTFNCADLYWWGLVMRWFVLV